MIATILLAAALGLPVTIPFDLEANHVVVDIAVNGHPTRALFDTGGANVVTPQFAREIGLKPEGRLRADGVGEGTVAIALTKVRDLTFGSIDMRDQRFAIIPLPGGLTHGDKRPIEAIVGAEILERYATRLDYVAHTLTFTPEADFAYRGDGVEVPIEFDRGSTPRAEGTIDGIPGLLQIDTGSAASLTVTTPFVASHDLERRYHPAGNVVVGRGLGGYTRADIARAGTVTIGKVEIDGPVVELSTDKRGAFASNRYAANLGNDVLSRFTITFDYARKAMYLEKTARTAAPPPYNRAGMYAQNDDPSFFEVAGVLPNGPAAEAGLQAGDRITAIDGTPAEAIEASEFWRLLHGPPGTRYTLEVERLGTPGRLQCTLTLREVV